MTYSSISSFFWLTFVASDVLARCKWSKNEATSMLSLIALYAEKSLVCEEKEELSFSDESSFLFCRSWIPATHSATSAYLSPLRSLTQWFTSGSNAKEPITVKWAARERARTIRTLEVRSPTRER